MSPRGRHLSRLKHKRRPPSVNDVAKLLGPAYPASNLGNKSNPLDELAFIILSGQTGGALARMAYGGFKRQFPRWEDVANTSLHSLESSIRVGGLSWQKARYLRAIARSTTTDFGRATLAPLNRMGTLRAEAYLRSLKGVGVKTARCVLLYSFKKRVFPADVHCLRVMTRLGWIAWHGERAERLADLAQDTIPPPLRRLLHVRFVQHGRAVCRARPSCPGCVLNHCCPTAQNGRYSKSHAEDQR
jgi:endonuclease III